jgi:Transposase DDE domain
MRAARGWLQGYNAQVAVDDAHLVVACDVSQDGFDNHALAPMIAATERALADAGVQAPVGCYLADAGYWKGETVTELAAAGLRVLVPANGRRRTKTPEAANASVATMERRLRHPANRRRYRRRQALVEPVIANVKINRGVDRFHLRGLDGARLEWSLACTAHNLMRLATLDTGR